MPPFLGCRWWCSFNDETPFQGTKAILTPVYMLICYCCFEILKEWIPDLLSGQKTKMDPERCCGEGGGRGVHVWERM